MGYLSVSVACLNLGSPLLRSHKKVAGCLSKPFTAADPCLSVFRAPRNRGSAAGRAIDNM